MSSNLKPIPVEDETELGDVLDEADHGHGERFRLMREDDDISYEPDAVRVRQVLDETLGSWSDVDVDAIIADIYEARRAGSRPPDRP